MTDKEIKAIKQMVEYTNKVIRYTDDCSFSDFMMNEEKIDATIFAISQIGEIVKNISESTMSKYKNIEWTVIKSLRNRIVHDYDGINLSLIWDIIIKDIPILKKNLLNILNS